MIHISRKFYLQKNDVYTNCINLIVDIIIHQKMLLTGRELSTELFHTMWKSENYNVWMSVHR